MNGYRNGRVSRRQAAEWDRYRPQAAQDEASVVQEEKPESDWNAETIQEDEVQYADDIPWQESSEQEYQDEYTTPEDENDPMGQAQLLATNRTVCLTCTLAAMMGLFALFLLYAQKESRAIRHNAVQSVILSIIHILVGGLCLLAGSILGAIPLVGFVTVLFCYLIYIAVLLYVIMMRVRLMLYAWRGLRYDVPGSAHWLKRYV